MQSLNRLWQQWQSKVDLREHEDKILLLLSLVISAIVGLVVVAFLVVTERLGSRLLQASAVQRLLYPLAGSLVGGWLLYTLFPDARGSGIPQTRVALILRKGYISLRTAIGKFICSSISLGSGVALGREGPSVHIGAGIASVAGRHLGLSEEHIRSLIPVGTAAAVAAAFNTPLAAVLFTLEEILADLHARVVGSVVIGAATSWIILRLILGDEPLFHVPAYQLVHPIEFLIYALLGLAGGVVSSLFVWLLLKQRELFQKLPQRWQLFSPGAGGLTVGLLALAVPGVLGVGYNLVSDALNGVMPWKMMAILLVMRLISTTTCYASGNAGGIFGPSLFIGAMLGGLVGQGAHTLMPTLTGNAGAYALVGMGAAFAGIIQTPMTSVIMIFEVTRDYTIIVPLMIANLCSYFLAQRLQKQPIYEALSRQDGIIMPSHAHRPAPLTVQHAMRAANTPDVPLPSMHFVHPDDTLDEALQRMSAAGLKSITVIHRAGGKHAGVLFSEDVLPTYQSASGRATESSDRKPAPSPNWLPVVAAVTLAGVLIISGLVFWQRSRRVDLGNEAYQAGRTMLEQGRVDDAVASFRSALAYAPTDLRSRAALGLALVQSAHDSEASSYLTQVTEAQPDNGPAWMGLARIALNQANQKEALRLFQRSFRSEWPPEREGERRQGQLEYARLLSDAGQRTQAVSISMTLIEQSGADPVLARNAADIVKAAGTAEQAEAAYTLLTTRFPGDSVAWMRLGDSRFTMNKERAALEAYRRAAEDSTNADAQAAVARTEEILRLDPNAGGQSIRERARRWDEILDRVVMVAATCPSKEIDDARKLRSTRVTRLEVLDRKIEATQSAWRTAPPECRTDIVLSHILDKTSE